MDDLIDRLIDAIMLADADGIYVFVEAPSASPRAARVNAGWAYHGRAVGRRVSLRIVIRDWLNDEHATLRKLLQPGYHDVTDLYEDDDG